MMCSFTSQTTHAYIAVMKEWANSWDAQFQEYFKKQIPTLANWYLRGTTATAHTAE